MRPEEEPETPAPEPKAGILSVLRRRWLVGGEPSTPEQQQRIRSLREELQAAAQETAALRAGVEQSDPFEAMEALHGLFERLGVEVGDGWKETRARRRETLEESEALQRIWADGAADPDGRVRELEAFLREHPKSDLAHQYLAGALETAGDPEGSMVVHREMVRRLSSRPEPGFDLVSARSELGRLLLETGDPAAAIVELRAALEGASDEDRVSTGIMRSLLHLQLGNALHAAGDLPAARAAWSEALEGSTVASVSTEARRMLEAHP